MSSLPHANKFVFPQQPYNFLRRQLPQLSDQGIDLLNALLTYDPAQRITARKALRHPFFYVSYHTACRAGAVATARSSP